MSDFADGGTMAEVADGLYISAMPLSWPNGIDLVIRCNRDAPLPTVPPGCRLIVQPFADQPMEQTTPDPYGDLAPSRETLFWLARQANESSRCLVHCYGGRNRSGIVVALALMFRGGMSADDAIARVRERRGPTPWGMAMENESFNAWLRSL